MTDARAVHPLRAGRQAVGMTRGELAVASGMNARMVEAVEMNETRPSRATSEAFERASPKAALARLDLVEDAVAAARLDAAADSSKVRA